MAVGIWKLVETGVLGFSSGSETGNPVTTSETTWIVGRWAETPSGCNTPGAYAEFHADGRTTTGTQEGRWQLAGERLTLTGGPQPATFTVRPVGTDRMTFDGESLTRCGDTEVSLSATSDTRAGTGGLETELSAGAERLRQQLPIVRGPITLSRVEQSGTTLTVYGTFSVDVTPVEWAQLDQIMPGEQCRTLRHLISRGATITYNLTDSANERHEIIIASCPESSSGAM